ncbi:MAG: radical SAM protein, partial [Deltaproteobacteria bacterium]|nr:radical SAM protein [Deltaproteobacteria bacterium]
LIAIARKKGFSQIRISGNEPTLCREHLLEVLSLVPREFRFILETNGILLGQEADYAANLAAFPNLHVRVGIKGASAEEFSRLTGAQPAAFALQLAALQNLIAAGVSSHPAVMVSFSSADNLKTLRNQLATISPHYRDFEAEEVVLYGDTGKRLTKANLLNSESHSPLPTKM